MTSAAFLLVGLSALLHAAWNLMARRLSGSLGALWLGLAAASVLGLAVSGPWAAWRLALPYLASTGALNALYFLLLAKAYEDGAVSFVYPLARGTAVAATAASSALLWREPLAPLGAAGIAAVASGAFLLAASRRTSAVLKPALCALAAGLLVAASYRLDREGSSLAAPLPYTAGLFAACVLFLAPYVVFKRRRELAEAWRGAKAASVLIGLGSMGGYLLIVYAYRLGALSCVIAAREFSVVIGSVLGVLVLGESVGLVSGLGIASVAAGLFLLRWS